MQTQPEPVDPRALGSRLQEARRARALTQQDVAERLRLARTTVVAIEKGERAVQPEELVAFAKLYGRDLHDLLRHREPLPEFAVQFRSAPGQLERDPSTLADLVDRFQQLCGDYAELERLRGAPLPRRYPPPVDVSGVPVDHAAEDLATAERNRLGLGDGPLPELRAVLESDVGLKIFALPMPGKIAGLVAFNEMVGGCVGLNAAHPIERQNWTLGHEYGHFLTRRYQPEVTVVYGYRRVPESERLADAFAGAFLMPAAGLSRRFNEVKRARQGLVTPADLLHLAHRYRVSFEAITRQLEASSLVPSGTYEDLRDRGFQVREAERPLDLAAPDASVPSTPLRYQLLAAEAFHQGQLSEGEFAHYLRLDRLSAREAYQSLRSQFAVSDDGGVRQLPLPLADSLSGPKS